MDLRIRDVARLLNVTENTVHGWARDGSLPSYRVNDDYRFNRVELQEWAATTRHDVSLDLFADEGTRHGTSPLFAAVERGGICRDIPGDRRDSVLEAVAQLPGIPAGIDRALLHRLLVAREAQASSGIGGGIALPHPRDPIIIPAGEPHVLICFLRQPIDFQAMDRQPIRVLFVVLAPSVRVHLQLLARIAHALHDGVFRKLLLEQASQELIFDRLRTLDTPPSGPPGDDGARISSGQDH
jgi:PTS system nitrogen regulatory IIA component